MNWVSFGKRVTVALIIGLAIAAVTTFVLFRIFTLYSFGFTLLLVSVVLILFGVCLLTPFVEAVAAYRYAVNPPHTRDTMRRFGSRRGEQSRSGVVILAAGGILLGIALGCLGVLVFLPP
jgi:hypothetical protein